MKKILLSLMLIGSFLFGKAQVVFNEIYPNPDSTSVPPNNEYLELFNTGAPVNLQCYTLLSWDNVNQQAWIYRLPAYPLATGEIVVLTGGTGGSIRYKHKDSPYTGTNQLSWNAAGADLKLYGRSGNTLTYIKDGPSPNILLDPSGGAGIALFLFDAAGNVVNGFVGSDQAVLPSNFAALTTDLILPATATCLAQPLDINGITTSETEFQNVISATGKDNGYYRTTNGLCGTWEKASSESEKTPGTSNGGAAASTFATVIATQSACNTGTGQVTYNPVSIKINNSIYNPSSYKIYEDLNGDLLLDPAVDQLRFQGTISDLLTHNFGPITLGDNHALLIQVSAQQNCLIFFRAYLVECISLPVHFKSFNATRSNASSVGITWTTAQEQNSKGFNVQKNVGGVWTTVAYVPSQALNGNSSSDLSYSYTDANNEKGITQYRIQQVDIDGKSKYSDIRAIRGDGSVSKLVVYPNPSSDGKVNVVFEDNSGMRDVQVSDMQGKIIRSFKGITNNILVIERLTTGFYTIKVTNRTTAASSVQKVVIK